jgi:hypothetical protein
MNRPVTDAPERSTYPMSFYLGRGFNFAKCRYVGSDATWVKDTWTCIAVRSRAGCAETGAEQFYFSPLYAWLGGLSEQPAFVLIGK